MRAIASTDPPARKGTTMCTGLLGKPWAKPALASVMPAASAATNGPIRRMGASLLRFHAGDADHLAPISDLGRDVAAHLLRRRADDLDAQIGEPLRHHGIVHG